LSKSGRGEAAFDEEYQRARAALVAKRKMSGEAGRLIKVKEPLSQNSLDETGADVFTISIWQPTEISRSN
jgi:alanine dehydrogenase